MNDFANISYVIGASSASAVFLFYFYIFLTTKYDPPLDHFLAALHLAAGLISALAVSRYLFSDFVSMFIPYPWGYITLWWVITLCGWPSIYLTVQARRGRRRHARRSSDYLNERKVPSELIAGEGVHSGNRAERAAAGDGSVR